jgi:ParB-like chromosome segregation protein Spo0J
MVTFVEEPEMTTNPLRINPRLAPLAVPISSVKFDPRNARKHPERNVKAIEASLRDSGQQKPVVVNERGEVIAGNGTLMAAQRLGATHVAVIVYDGTPEAARRFALADNRTAELAEWDDAALASLISEMSSAPGFDPELIGFDDTAIREILGADAMPVALPDEVDESAADRVAHATCPSCGHRFPL